MQSRRHLLKTALAAGALAGVRTGRAAAPAAEILERRVISRQPLMYHGWPTLARRANRELLLVCSGGREAHVCPFGRVELMRSADEGRTWSYPRTVLDGPIDDRDAGVLETAAGTILITTFTSLAYEPLLAKQSGEVRERWEAAHNRVNAGQRKQALGCWMIRSTDGGLTFSGRYRVPVNSPHGPVQLADGRLLYAGKALWEPDKRVGVCESIDDGRTWKWLADIPVRDGDRRADYHELHAVENPDGSLVLQLRNHNKRHHRETLQCRSTDGGRSWSTPRSIEVWGLPSHLLRLGDGRLLMSYGHRRKPFGNQARISEDGGATWSEAITVSDDGTGGDLGYPSTVQLADGTLLTAWYEKMAGPPKAVLRQARWKLE